MAYSDLPWRPFLGHQAWSWITLRRGNVFYYVYKRFFYFCHAFYVFNVFLKFLLESFLHLFLLWSVCSTLNNSYEHVYCSGSVHSALVILLLANHWTHGTVVAYTFKKVKVKTEYSSSQHASPLRELTCHMGSHSVTCHPAEVTFPPLPQPKLVLD